MLNNAYTAANYAAIAKSKKENWDQLQAEIETSKLFVAQIKQMIKQATTRKHITSCTLPNLMDAVNAFQDFLQSNIQGPLNSAFWNVVTPEGQRVELLSFVNNIQMEFTVYQMEMQTYWDIVLDHLADEGNLNNVQAALQAQTSECARIQTAFNLRVDNADICPKCTLNNISRETITQRYARLHKQNLEKNKKN